MSWWKQAVFYEIYIRSFQDSNDDGVGDLNGDGAAGCDYLADLGVDAIWITPFYPSPQVDFGYDVCDHEDVDPQFGTLADFDRLLAAAHAAASASIIDIVLNHTSDRHAWFQASRSSRSSPSATGTCWRDGAAAGRPPNNWESAFGGRPGRSIRDGAVVLPLLLSRSSRISTGAIPMVEQRMFETLGFWLDRGVDGFRLDAVNSLFEDPGLRDNPPLPEPRITLTGVENAGLRQHQVPSRSARRAAPRCDGSSTAAEPDASSSARPTSEDVDDLVRFYGEDDEMHLPFNFFLAQVRRREAAAIQAGRGPRRTGGW